MNTPRYTILTIPAYSDYIYPDNDYYIKLIDTKTNSSYFIDEDIQRAYEPRKIRGRKYAKLQMVDIINKLYNI